MTVYLTPNQVNCHRNAQLFAELNRETGRDHVPGNVTRGLIAMLEGIWADYFLYPDEYEPGRASAVLSLFLDALYPGSFDFEKAR